jgi:cupin fold WbuC family metalloprotein
MKVFSSQYFKDLFSAASQSQRLRAHANVHRSYAEHCQKLFNAIKVNSYIRPHRHSLDPKDECLIAVRGLFGLIEFNDQGETQRITLFGSEKYSEQFSIAAGVELPAGAWHTVVSLVDNSVLFEVKSGPFDPSIAKEFAPWAPVEGSVNAGGYNKGLVHETLASLNVSDRAKIESISEL